MAVASNTNTFYFLAGNGKIYQINGVEKITISSPLLANGWFRDEPAIVVGGAGASISSDNGAGSAEIQVAGGTAPTATTTTSGGNSVTAEVEGDSSVLQSDSFTHVDLRFIFAPMSMIFFQTDAGIATNPTNATFSKTRPAANFDAFDVDCCFPWTEDCGVFNAPPQGWAPSDSR